MSDSISYRCGRGLIFVTEGLFLKLAAAVEYLAVLFVEIAD
jgi:hypothetical protein